MSSRLQSREDKILLLDYLVSELMSARMVSVNCPKEKQGTGMNILVVSLNFLSVFLPFVVNLNKVLPCIGIISWNYIIVWASNFVYLFV